MTLFRALSAAAIGASALSMGCSGAGGDNESSGAPAMDDTLYSTMAGIHGTGGNNNLHPLDFHANKVNLFGATLAALAAYAPSDATWWLANSAPNSALLGTTGGREVLKYAVQCALSTSSTVRAQLGSSAMSFTGQSIVTTTSGWKTAALTRDATDDLFTCLLAHLNAHGVEVPINISGPHIVNAPGYDPAFDWEEALWAVKVLVDEDGGVAFNLYVWPMNDLTQCADHVTGLSDRVCGLSDDACGLTVRTDRDDACTETATGWFCDDVSGHPLPAVLTRLKAADATSMYSDCP
jgi:hypothetical protein